MAYKNFLVALDMAASLLKEERRISRDPPPPDKQSLVSGLRGGAAVLMVAAFEVFLDDLITEYVQYAANYKPRVRFEKLPARMQEWNVFQTLKTALDGPKHETSTPRYARIPAIRAASEQVARLELNPLAFAGTGGNPNKKAVKKLFQRIGVSDVFAFTRTRFSKKWGWPIADTFAEDTLEAIVNRRHRVAHRADALSISRKDLWDAIRFLKVFGETIDIDVARYMKQTCRLASKG